MEEHETCSWSMTSVTMMAPSFHHNRIQFSGSEELGTYSEPLVLSCLSLRRSQDVHQGGSGLECITGHVTRTQEGNAQACMWRQGKKLHVWGRSTVLCADKGWLNAEVVPQQDLCELRTGQKLKEFSMMDEMLLCDFCFPEVKLHVYISRHGFQSTSFLITVKWGKVRLLSLGYGGGGGGWVIDVLCPGWFGEVIAKVTFTLEWSLTLSVISTLNRLQNAFCLSVKKQACNLLTSCDNWAFYTLSM